jgi:hypothetical protein
MVLASLSGTGAVIVIGAYAVLCLLIFLASPRDVNGRKRALGCSLGLFFFFGLFVIAFAAWAADAIF